MTDNEIGKRVTWEGGHWIVRARLQRDWFELEHDDGRIRQAHRRDICGLAYLRAGKESS